MSANDRHNKLAPELFKRLIEGTDGEAEAMVVIETLFYGMLLYFRPKDVRAQILFLETMTEAVIERLGK